MEEITAVAIRRAAMDLLARREHTQAELKSKLNARFGADAGSSIAEALEQLAAENLQSDERFLQVFIQSKVRRLFGPLHIKYELRQRGFTDAVIESALADAQIVWRDVRDKLEIKKFGSRPPANFEERARRQRFLLSRGFHAAHAYE